MDRLKNNRPMTDSSSYLRRNRLVSGIVGRLGGKKALCVTARAGQGKTVLAAQLLDQLSGRHCWYQGGHEDRDPVFLLRGLAASLREAVPGLRNPALDAMMSRGELGLPDYVRYSGLLADAVREAAREETFLVVDDVHLLGDSEGSMLFLRSFLELSPERLRFVLLSRGEESLVLTGGLPDSAVLHVPEDRLAFSRSEIAALYDAVLGRPQIGTTVRTVHEITEGWIMGVLMADKVLRVRENYDVERLAEYVGSHRHAEAARYFQSELLARLPTRESDRLLKLSLLGDVPGELAAAVCGADTPDFLEKLVKDNFFLRRTSGSVYVFHHMFRSCLVAMAEERLSPDVREECLLRAADWYLDRDEFDSAIRLLTACGSFERVRTILRECGFGFLAESRQSLLLTVVHELPREMVETDPWLLYFRAAAELLVSPGRSLEDLYLALGQISDEDGLLELLLRGVIIRLHVSVDGRIGRIAEHLSRVEYLYGRLGRDLPPIERVETALSLGVGHSYISFDLERAMRFLDESLFLAEDAGLFNKQVEVICWKINVYVIFGRLPETHALLDQYIRCMENPRLDPVNRLLLLCVAMNVMVMEGDFDNYECYRAYAFSSPHPAFVRGSILKGLTGVWDIVACFGRCRCAEAGERVERLLAGTGGAASNLRAQALQYRAVTEAVFGKPENVPELVEASREIVLGNGVPVFIHLNAVVAGSALVLAGRPEQALPMLNDAVEADRKLRRHHMLIASSLTRAAAFLGMGNEGEALEDIAIGLGKAAQLGLSCAYGLTAPVLELVLGPAVRHGIEVVQARFMAAERLGRGVSDDGKFLPLLRVRTLGSVELTGEEGEPVRLSRNRRELFALLAAVPTHSLGVDEIMTVFWPEKDPAKARSSFDTLIRRVREVISDLPGAYDPKFYLMTEGKELRLANAVFDGDAFETFAVRGLDGLRNGREWQSENALRRAVALWRGDFAPGVWKSYEVANHRERLGRMLLRASAELSRILQAQGRSSDAADAARVGFLYDSSDMKLARRLYDLYIVNGDVSAASGVLRMFKASLENLDFPTEDVEKVLAKFWED